MSAGTGVVHSEYNHGKELLRLFQIWILPDRKELKPNYGDVRFALDDRKDRWLLLASSLHDAASPAPIRVHADINAWASLISPGRSLDFEVDPGRQVYLALIEGSADLQGKAGSSLSLSMRDAAEISEESFTVSARPDSDMPAHVLVIEMMRDTGNGPV
jgi:redox-sensitive bicupin YhaK (pirin superfamily)